MDKEPVQTGASDAGADQTPQSTETKPTQPSTDIPKFELVDGKMKVGDRSVVYESDLIHAKEILQERLDKQQAVHSEAVDKARLELSEAQKQTAAANARVQELETTQANAAPSDPEEVARLKQEKEAAESRAGQAETTALELRRKAISIEYRFPPDKLADKDATQLDALEEALKALAGSGGPGNYAVGAGAGQTSAQELTAEDRARRILENTPYSTRSGEPLKTQ
jgi:DNA repair exonuclease SbcCD ATPase subunit